MQNRAKILAVVHVCILSAMLGFCAEKTPLTVEIAGSEIKIANTNTPIDRATYESNQAQTLTIPDDLEGLGGRSWIRLKSLDFGNEGVGHAVKIRISCDDATWESANVATNTVDKLFASNGKSVDRLEYSFAGAGCLLKVGKQYTLELCDAAGNECKNLRYSLGQDASTIFGNMAYSDTYETMFQLNGTFIPASASINFYEQDSAILGQPYAAGLGDFAVPGEYWNNIKGVNTGEDAQIKSLGADGTYAAGMSLAISKSRGAWRCTSLAYASDIRYSYIDDNYDNPEPKVVVKGIPYEKYRVVLYHSTETANSRFGWDTVNGIPFTADPAGTRTMTGELRWGDSGPKNSANPIAEGVNTLVTPIMTNRADQTLTVDIHSLYYESSARHARAGLAAMQIIDATGETDDRTLLTNHVASTESAENATWVFPDDAMTTDPRAFAALTIGTNGVRHVLAEGSEYANPAFCVLAAIPEKAQGTLFGFGVAGGNEVQIKYNGDGTFLMTYNGQAAGVTGTLVTTNINVSGVHAWKVTYDKSEGTKLFRDGELVAHNTKLKWRDKNMTGAACFFVRHGAGDALPGATFYGAATHYWPLSVSPEDAVFNSFANLADGAALADASLSTAQKAALFELLSRGGDAAALAPLDSRTTTTLASGYFAVARDSLCEDGDHLDANKTVFEPLVQHMGAAQTNAASVSVLAELPDGKSGVIVSIPVKQGDTVHSVYAYAHSDGTVSLGWGGTTTYDSKRTEAMELADGPHVWTLAHCAGTGTRLYLDGVELLASTSLKWRDSSICGDISIGNSQTQKYPLAGLKTYAAHSDFAASNAIFDTAADGVAAVYSVFPFMADVPESERQAAFAAYLETGSVTLAPSDESEITHECVLRISEIMPKPTDAQDRGALEGMDVNGLDSGWVEVENTSDLWADLADYRFIRINRGKKVDAAGSVNFPTRYVAPHSRAVFYTSERYPNSDEEAESAFEEGTFDGAPAIYPELNNVLVWGKKINPKKFPFVRLYFAPGGEVQSIVDTVEIPSDVPEGCSIIVGETVAGEATARWLCDTPTRGHANTSVEGLKRIGPTCGPLYELKNQKKHDSTSEFARPAPPAAPGEDYDITFSYNPVMHPREAGAFRQEDALAAIRIVYRTDLNDATLKTNDVNFATKKTDAKDWGDTFVATIPSGDLPAPGHLLQWKFIATDACGNEWTSPSFNNPDDGYEWYGTIVAAPELESASLPTWHMFATPESIEQMDVDASEQDRSKVPNQARIAIYDSSTSNYYDYVRIDLRGNTSKRFTKKSHGLRFAKAHPLAMADAVAGGAIEGIRKTSLVSEFADPSLMRQMVAFWLWRKMGNLVPFDFPVRCNLNGEFFQLAFNSERFTDELIEDVYGLDKFGYGYKNVGTLKSGSGTTAGDIEKKTPDDENETDISVLENELRRKLYDNGVDNVRYDVDGSDTGLDNAALTKFVVEKFNLPAWLNYLASARITQEMDDVWANVCAYWDNAEMKQGVRGTDTWMPLGYDFNISFGQYYKDVAFDGSTLTATNDWFKSHPFYGGNRVRCWSSPAMTSRVNEGNRGFEAVWQSAKFRRLYLRRLRTLMDAELKAPGTPENETPFMVKMRELADAMSEDAALDRAKWPNDSTDDMIDAWGAARPENIDAGIDDIWENYVVPRRVHLYVTHSATNTARAVGYGSNLNAGIPEAQSPVEALAPLVGIANSVAVPALAARHGIKGEFCDPDVLVITNGNAEAVDMSGWTLSGAVSWTLPAGAVCDANDCLYIVRDRRAYIAAHADELTDQVIIGNVPAKKWKSGEIALAAADGTSVWATNPVGDRTSVYDGFSSTIAGYEDWWRWSVPSDAFICTNATKAIFTAIGASPIVQDIEGLATNAVAVSVLAEIPASAQGAVIGLVLSDGTTASYSVYVYAKGDGTFGLRYGDGSSTGKGVDSGVRDLSRPHLWTLACMYNGGLRFYEDGVEIARDDNIKWTTSFVCKPAFAVYVGNERSGTRPLNGMEVYSIATSAANDNSIYGAAQSDYAALVESVLGVAQLDDPETIVAALENYFRYGISKAAVKVNDNLVSPEASAAAVNMFGPAALGEAGVVFKIDSIDPSAGNFKITVSPGMESGSLSVMAKRELQDRWERVAVNPSGDTVAIDDAASSGYRFFQIRAELGAQAPGYAVRESLDVGDSGRTGSASHLAAAETGGDALVFSMALSGGDESDYGAAAYRSLEFALEGVAEGAEARLAVGTEVRIAQVGADGRVVFADLPALAKGATLSLSVATSTDDGMIAADVLAGRSGVASYSWADGVRTEVAGGVTNAMTLLARSPLADGLGGNANGVFRIPAIAMATNGAVVAIYDCRYRQSGDLPGAFDLAENWSGDAGATWTKPRVAINVPNNGEQTVGKATDVGDPCILYDPASNRFWCMAITGKGLRDTADSADVVLYTRGTGRDELWQEWTGGPDGNRRSVQQMILDSLAAVDPGASKDQSAIKGILQGPGHGFVQRKTVFAEDGVTVLMPAGALVFPMQYFQNDASRTFNFAAYSTDGGATWKATKRTPADDGNGFECYAQEGSVVELDDGSWEFMGKYGNGGTDAAGAKGRRLFFRSRNCSDWTFDGYLEPSIRVQGSCLRIGEDADGVGRYVACFPVSGNSSSARRSHITLHFGRDTSGVAGAPGITWDGGTVDFYPEATGGYAYSSLVMLDENTLGILFESKGHIYLRKFDIRPYLGL